MSTKLPIVRPAALEFGNVQIGSIATHQLVFTNNTSTTIEFSAAINLNKSSTAFHVEEQLNSILRPFTSKKVDVQFKPTVNGEHQQEIFIRETETNQEQCVLLLGTGISAVRNSFRHVDLPEREIEKSGKHYVLAIAKNEFLRSLELYLRKPLEWYTVISTGTKGGKIKTPGDCQRGEVFLAREVSMTDQPSAAFGFDIQQVFYKWKTDIIHTITDSAFLDEINEAMGHCVDRCQRNVNRCRNQLTPDYNGLGKLMLDAPDEGDIFEITKDGIVGLFAVISPTPISARYTKCFYKKAALVVRVESSEAEDETSTYGVLTEPIERLGRLWVACHTVSMCSLESNSKTNYHVRPKDLKLSTDDLQAVRERVLGYIGIE